jgi:general stress protein YciG
MPIESQGSMKTPARRGFAAMDKDRQREIARKGGASVPDEKRSFSQDRDLAAAAGRKGGEASHGGGRTSRPSYSGAVS